jgi:tetratricopeptide (TPR) repeat protein
MPEPVDDRRRTVVPRWWNVRVAASLGQLDAATTVRVAAPPSPIEGEVEALVLQWQLEPNRFHAANLIDAAITLERPHIASDAAAWILEHGGVSSVSEDLARLVVGGVEVQDSRSVPTPNGRHKAVADYRRSLRAQPRNPILWVEIAREYSALGQTDAARRALNTALALAPNSRHVLRSASRFFLHVHEPDRAHSILLASDALRSDPWLMSAEIVAASATGKESRLLKKSRDLVESGRVHPRHISELASAIGTVEHDAGNRKQVRKLFRHALVAPTENSVAQAGWIERHMPGFDLPDELLATPRAFEAQAWEAVQLGDYEDAISHSLRWAEDEPFATRPVLFGSWVSSMGLGDFVGAAQMAEAARLANASDPRLVALILYCRASAGDLAGAQLLFPELERLVRADETETTRAEWDVVLEADKGLLAFRSGSPVEGRLHYENALQLAARHRLRESAATALVNLAREEALATGQMLDQELLDAAVIAFPQPIRGVVEAFVRRITAPGDRIAR